MAYCARRLLSYCAVLLSYLPLEGRNLFRRCSSYAVERRKRYSTQYAQEMFTAVTHHKPMTEIERLARAYPDVLQAQDANGRTPLHWAALDGMVTAVELFLALGADVDVQDVRGDTPLHLAVANTSNLINRLNTITVLMDEGASPIIRNEWGLNTLDRAKLPAVQSHLFDLGRKRVELVRHRQQVRRRIGRLTRESKQERERYFEQRESVSAAVARERQAEGLGQPIYGGAVRRRQLIEGRSQGRELAQSYTKAKAYRPGDELVSVFEQVEQELAAKRATDAADDAS